MKIPKSLDNLFNNIYFLYFVSFLAVFNVFAYIIMNNFNAIILFILVGYITYLFSKNMAIVLLVALLLTNLFMSSKTNRMGREGMTGSDTTDDTGTPDNDNGSADNGNGNGNGVGGTSTGTSAGTSTGTSTGASGATSPTPSASSATTTKKKPTLPASPASSASTTTGNILGMQNMNMQSVDLDKMQGLLNQSQQLIGDLKNAFPGMGNILGSLGQQ